MKSPWNVINFPSETFETFVSFSSIRKHPKLPTINGTIMAATSFGKEFQVTSPVIML